MKRFLHTVMMAMIPGALYAAGYTCDVLPTYISCEPDYYLAVLNGDDWTYVEMPIAGNACRPCPDGYTCAGGTAAPVADKCPAGQYRNAAGECTLCDIGYYCPGDDARHYCNNNIQAALYSDEPGATACKPCPPAPDGSAPWYWPCDSCKDDEAYIHSTVSKCRATWAAKSEPHGVFTSFSCSYGTNGYGEYEEDRPKKCMGQISKCDAGYWFDASHPVITGGTVTFWFHSYAEFMENEFCVPAGYGYYSVAGAVTRTKCPTGYTTTTETAASSAECNVCADGYAKYGDVCLPVCGAGIGELHVGPYTYTLWKNKPSDIAINIKSNNVVCYVGLADGAAAGALNINVGGAIYHATN